MLTAQKETLKAVHKRALLDLIQLIKPDSDAKKYYYRGERKDKE